MTWEAAARKVLAEKQYALVDNATGVEAPPDHPDVQRAHDAFAGELFEPDGTQVDDFESELVLLDYFTASALIAVLDGLRTPEAREKFLGMAVARAGVTAHRVIARANERAG